MTLETLDEQQAEMQTRSEAARKKRNSRNARSKKKKGLRARVSVKTLLVMLAQDQSKHCPGRVRAWAIQQLLLLGEKPIYPFEKYEPQETPATAPVREPVDWSAKSV